MAAIRYIFFYIDVFPNIERGLGKIFVVVVVVYPLIPADTHHTVDGGEVAAVFVSDRR